MFLHCEFGKKSTRSRYRKPRRQYEVRSQWTRYFESHVLTVESRRGFRRGQDIADALRIEIRDLEDRDDLGPRSSPSSPDSPGSTASSASPTKTTFPAVAAPTAAPPPPGVTATPAQPPLATTTTNPTVQPVVATSVLSSTTLVSAVMPTGTPTIAPSIRPSTVRQTKPESTSSAIPANGIAEKGGSDRGGGGGAQPMSKAAIALGVIGKSFINQPVHSGRTGETNVITPQAV